MDPVTHGVIGLAISAFSGDPVTISNPISLGCAIGAMSPDIDIVAKIKGDYTYLKHHRGISHSIPVLLGLAAIITTGLSLFFADLNFFQVFLWTFIGCLSHTAFDILNSYGAKLFMPFSKKKLMVGILMLYDPIITVLCFLLIFIKYKSTIFYVMILISFFFYLGVRWMMKKYAEGIVKSHYKHGYKIIDINILPALMAFHKWDFIVNTKSHNLVGQVNIFNKKILERKKFKKASEEIVQMFKETKIGKYFREFTPIYHVMKLEELDNIILKSIDLRYYLRNNFMHHATVVYDREQNIIESFFHPYNIQKNIRVAEVE
ncbi:metal-dependent hydrolase [Crassaminicella thermophila]|uniref:Metal-dependent hydrolase n=1 Tax=Crassaminicella thermophila TaxID=2599308 RepID=A0A5C0SDJ3_CRATE|nr:metal-dependent hydrolase [Crassaminicella thermophila]QEK12331.1 metal-dependent hydrolase [Crassaminicella thermophila]